MALLSVPTAYGRVHFMARRTTADTASVSFRYTRHAGGFSVPLTNVTMRLVTPQATGVRAVASVDQLDPWTIRLAVLPDRWHNFSIGVEH